MHQEKARPSDASTDRDLPAALRDRPPTNPSLPVDVAVMLGVQRSAGNRAAVRLAHGPGLSTAPRPTVQRRRDPGLDSCLADLRQMAAMPYNDRGRAEAIDRRLHGIDLADPDNLVPVTEVVSGLLPPELLERLLSSVDRPARRATGPTDPDPLRALRELNNPRRGPYGLRGPGVLLPVAVTAARPLLEPLANALSSVDAFVRGVYTGVNRSVGPEAADALAERLMQSSILNLVFSPVFLAGTAVGIARDARDAIVGAYEFVVGFEELATQAAELARAFLSPDGAELGRILGEEVGTQSGAELVRLSGTGVFEFTYECGKIAGPAIVYTILSFIGIPEVAAAAWIGRLASRLRPLLRRFPRLAALAERAARRLRNRPTSRLRGHTAEGAGADFTHGPLPEVPGDIPTGSGRLPSRTDGDRLASYAEARRPGAGGEGDLGSPATAAADASRSGPHIRDNLYTGRPQQQVTRSLRQHGILDTTADGTIQIIDPDRYLTWLERAYRQRGGAHMDERMMEAVRAYIGDGGPIQTVGVNPHSGGASFAGSLPGTHAEVLAINDLLVAGGAGPVDVATVRVRIGGHFAACLHCRGIIERLSARAPSVRLWTGVAGPR